MKRCYFVYNVDDNVGLAIVAKSRKEAMKDLGYRFMSDYNCEYIDIAVRWKKGVDVSGYDYGFVFEDEEDMTEAVRLGIYGYVEDGKCLKCGHVGHIEHTEISPHVLCLNCIDKDGDDK